MPLLECYATNYASIVRYSKRVLGLNTVPYVFFTNEQDNDGDYHPLWLLGLGLLATNQIG